MTTPAPKQDVTSRNMPTIDWAADPAGAAQALYDHALRLSDGYADWYRAARKPKRRWGAVCRVSAILATAASGVVPLLSTVCPDLSPVWASLCLLLAALCVSLDKFGDLTAGWVRYIKCAQDLVAAENAFKMDWEDARARLTDDALKDKQLQLLKTFITRCDALLLAETRQWADAFSKTLAQMEPPTPTPKP